MSDTPASTTGSVRLEELLALNEEIAALVRAGVPLELGLREYGSSMRGAIGRLSQRLSDRMENGLSLQEALDEEGDHLPGVYRAVVEAGLRAGRLPEALETLSRVARSLLALHRQVVSALIYPAIVLVLIFLMTFAFAEYIIPVFLDTWEALRLEPGTALLALEAVHESRGIWGLAIPVLALIFFLGMRVGGGYHSASSAGRLVSGRLHRFAWLPGIVRNYDLATFLKSLSLLVQHETPLHEAVLLAGYSTGNRHIIADATTVAQRLREGQPLEKALESTARLPGFLKWMFRSGRDAGSMQETLELTADIYQKRASRRAELLQTVLPVVLTAGLAGTLTLVYCLMLFAPIHELYSKLGEPLK